LIGPEELAIKEYKRLNDVMSRKDHHYEDFKKHI